MLELPSATDIGSISISPTCHVFFFSLFPQGHATTPPPTHPCSILETGCCCHRGHIRLLLENPAMSGVEAMLKAATQLPTRSVCLFTQRPGQADTYMLPQRRCCLTISCCMHSAARDAMLPAAEAMLLSCHSCHLLARQGGCCNAE